MRNRAIGETIRRLVLGMTLMAMSAPGFAQTLDLTGRIVDAQGAGVAGATVRVSRASGGVPTIVISRADGTYAAAGLTAGMVSVALRVASGRWATRGNSTVTTAPRPGPGR